MCNLFLFFLSDDSRRLKSLIRSVILRKFRLHHVQPITPVLLKEAIETHQRHNKGRQNNKNWMQGSIDVFIFSFFHFSEALTLFTPLFFLPPNLLDTSPPIFLLNLHTQLCEHIATIPCDVTLTHLF